MQPVKWCPKCGTPTGSDKLLCHQCGYEYRMRLTLEPDEPLHTFTPHPAARNRRGRGRKPLVLTLSGLVMVAALYGLYASRARPVPPAPAVAVSAAPPEEVTPETVRAWALELYKIRVDMTAQQVVSAVGEPTERRRDAGQERWHYQRGPYFVNCWIDPTGYVSRVQGSMPKP